MTYVAILGIAIVMAGTGILMVVCQIAYTYVPTLRLRSRDIVGTRNYWIVIALNVIAILGTYTGGVLLFSDFLIRTGPTHWYEAILAILLYSSLALYAILLRSTSHHKLSHV